jgi:peroxiredoxin Q/BCP
MAIKEGDKAPEFTLPAGDGSTVALKDLKGKKVVLYFYPKDNTPGCTKEACNFRDNHAALEKAGAVVLGVSADSVKSHQSFAGKYHLPFKLLADEGAKVGTAYGAWGEKMNYGKKYMGMYRMTFLIDEQGRVAKVWPKVKAETHGDEVLKALTA